MAPLPHFSANASDLLSLLWRPQFVVSGGAAEVGSSKVSRNASQARGVLSNTGEGACADGFDAAGERTEVARRL